MRNVSRRSRHKLKRLIKAIGLILLILLFIKGVFLAVKYTPLLYGLVFQKKINLKKTADNKVNVVLLGIGGGTHDGPNLSDTIIFASVDPDKQKVTLVSIPRDVWIPDLKAKINSAYADGQEDHPGGGLTLAKSVVSKVVGQDIDYGVRIDFSGFVKAVDLVGGITVQVDNTLDDYAYPTEGKEDDTCGFADDQVASLSAQIATASATESDSFPCRFEHLHVDKGLQHMDGTLALKFVRSRHALGVEGSDFARSRRQQKVISAFKDTLLSAGTLLNPVKLVGLYNDLKTSIDTDIDQSEFDDFFRLAQKLKGAKITSTVIDYGDGASNRFGLLTNPQPSTEFGGQWVLTPRLGTNNFSEIQQFVRCEITSGNCQVPQKPGSGIITPTPTGKPTVKSTK